MPTFSGRVEARYTVPSSTTVSATVANGGGATSVTLPAANYYHTAAGGVSSGITALQTALNENSQGYPQSAAAVTAAIRAGTTWSAGWLFNVASGNDTGAFGGVTMTAVSSPTYHNVGPRSGIDYAIGFDSNADCFTAGDNFDVNAAADMAWAWVANFGTNVLANFISKGTAGGGGVDGRLVVYTDGANGVNFTAHRSSDGASLGSCVITQAALFADIWHVGIATIDRATGKMRVGIRTLAGTEYLGTETTIAASDTSSAANFTVGVQNVATTPNFKMAALYVAAGAGVAAGLSANISTALTNFANAINAAWTVSLSTTTGLVSIGWTGYTTPTWSLSWTSTDLRDVLGFTANISGVTTTQTGTEQAEGLWFPDAPLNCDDHPSMGPRMSDLRTSQSPTGVVLGLAGNTFFKHTNVRWEHSPVDRIREASATYANASLEVFWEHTQLGLGPSWFSVSSPIQVYWSNAGVDTLLGTDETIEGWTITGAGAVKDIARPSQPNWVGQFNVTLPALIASE